MLTPSAALLSVLTEAHCLALGTASIYPGLARTTNSSSSGTQTLKETSLTRLNGLLNLGVSGVSRDFDTLSNHPSLSNRLIAAEP